MKKNLAGLGIEPQDYKMTYFETWCLSLQDHEISDLYQNRVQLLVY